MHLPNSVKRDREWPRITWEEVVKDMLKREVIESMILDRIDFYVKKRINKYHNAKKRLLKLVLNK